MRNNLEMKKQSGFTLIEIAIVMVIIGLLIGGVLKGQAMIDNAKIKSVVHDIQGVQAAWYTYYDRKHAYATPDPSLIATTPQTTWTSVAREQGLLTGNQASTVTPLNAMGGHIAVETSTGLVVSDFSGPFICTSVLAKYAQGIDATLDDGVATTGIMRGFGSAPALGNGPVLDEDPADVGGTAQPLTAVYATRGYVTLCMQP